MKSNGSDAECLILKSTTMKAKVWFDGVEYVAERNGIKGYGDSKQEAIARLERKEERERVRIELDNLLKR